jgi:hypothetical protein
LQMKRNYILIWSGVILIMIGLFLIYWFMLSPPSDFPGKQFAKSEITDTFPEADIRDIQDIIMLDDKHAYIPFTTNQESYGGSLWEWKKHKWQFLSIDTDFKPRIWKLESHNPESYIIIWNLHPQNNLEILTFSLKKEKGYSVTEGQEIYQPSVQIEYKKRLAEEVSYGFINIPAEWKKFITEENKILPSDLPDPFFDQFYQQPQYYFGWRSLSKEGIDEYPQYPQYSNGFGTGDSFVEQMIYLDKTEIK